jgi:hypothetical protein
MSQVYLEGLRTGQMKTSLVIFAVALAVVSAAAYVDLKGVTEAQVAQQNR